MVMMDSTNMFVVEMIKKLAKEAGRKVNGGQVRPLAPMASCMTAGGMENRRTTRRTLKMNQGH